MPLEQTPDDLLIDSCQGLEVCNPHTFVNLVDRGVARSKFDHLGAAGGDKPAI